MDPKINQKMIKKKVPFIAKKATQNEPHKLCKTRSQKVSKMGSKLDPKNDPQNDAKHIYFLTLVDLVVKTPSATPKWIKNLPKTTPRLVPKSESEAHLEKNRK